MTTDPYALPVECPELAKALRWTESGYRNCLKSVVREALAALCALVREQDAEAKLSDIAFDSQKRQREQAEAQLAAEKDECAALVAHRDALEAELTQNWPEW
jgi:hypothetical protein